MIGFAGKFPPASGTIKAEQTCHLADTAVYASATADLNWKDDYRVGNLCSKYSFTATLFAATTTVSVVCELPLFFFPFFLSSFLSSSFFFFFGGGGFLFVSGVENTVAMFFLSWKKERNKERKEKKREKVFNGWTWNISETRSAQRDHSPSNAVVKHERAWSPYGGWPFRARLCMPTVSDFPGVTILSTVYTPQKFFGWDYQSRSSPLPPPPRVYTNVRVRWIMDTYANKPSMYRSGVGDVGGGERTRWLWSPKEEEWRQYAHLRNIATV